MNEIICGDALDTLKTLPSGIVQTCVTSPPYYGLRDYGVSGQIGLEDTPEAYISRLVEVFREVRRVLRDDGTLWLNCGDSFSAGGSRREVSCDTCGKERANYQDRDFLYESLCGACLSDLLSHKFHIYQQPVPMPIVSLSDPNQEHKASERDHPPTLDFSHQKQTRQSYDAKQGQENITSLFDEQLHVVQESMTGVSSLQPLDAHLLDANVSYDPSNVGSLVDYAQASSHTSSHAPVETSGYNQGNVSLSEVQQPHSRYTSGYCSRCASYSDTLLTNIQAHCTTCAKASQALGSKQLLGIPWRLAFALQADGWILRMDCIWHKPNCMPESVEDRPTKSHEYIFLLSKNERYFYDADAIREPQTADIEQRFSYAFKDRYADAADKTGYRGVFGGAKDGLRSFNPAGRNKRSVWTVSTSPFSAAHFATFPPKLIEPCILAGTSQRACEQCGAPWERGWQPTGHVNKREPAHAPNSNPTKADSTGWARMRTATDQWEPTCYCNGNKGEGKCIVLDPFCGAGTVPLVSLQHHRAYIGIELNPEYIALANKRIHTTQPVLWEVSA